MARVTKQSFLVASAILAVGATSLPADARSLPGYGGRAWLDSESGCFSEWYGTVTNNCSGTRIYFIPLATDVSGYRDVTVTAYGAAPANNVGCNSLGLNKEATLFWGGSVQYLTTFGSAFDITLPGTWVPPNGYLYASCYMNEGGRVNRVSW